MLPQLGLDVFFYFFRDLNSSFFPRRRRAEWRDSCWETSASSRQHLMYFSRVYFFFGMNILVELEVFRDFTIVSLKLQARVFGKLLRVCASMW